MTGMPADIARENARHRDGKFGLQEHTPPEAALSAPYVFDKDYNNHEQVRPYMEEFLRVYSELEQPGRGFVYDYDFRGRIPGIAGPDEGTAIYLLQNLRRLDQLEVTKAEFIASGGRRFSASELEPGQTLRGTLVRAGFYMGGTGWEVHENVRVSLWPDGSSQPVAQAIGKGKRNGRPLFDGELYFRED